MPGSVAKAGLASAILPPPAIADTIIRQWQAVA
jgi:chemotaxis response regulator CheB